MPVVKIEQEVSQQFIDDTLCTALDAAYGWSYYWIEDIRVSGLKEGVAYDFEAIARGGTLRIKVLEEGWENLTLKKYLNGLALYAGLPEGNTPAHLADDPADGPMADCILQLALFGEVVFG